MKLFIPFLLSFLIVQCASNNIPELYKKYNSNEYLYWSNTSKLTWDDFQGIPIDLSGKTASGIHVYNPATIEKENIFTPAKLTAICVFDKRTSWVNEKVATKSLLLYDQVIFDIYELYTRKLREEFSKTDFNIDNYKVKFRQLTEKNNRELIKNIEQFRKDTSSGQIAEATILWNYKISNELNRLEKYNSNFSK
ncbi:MAG: hypothetical protein ACYDA4_09455 [Ignavibacteriaceae bacterium]